jgi:hypothetical protein
MNSKLRKHPVTGQLHPKYHLGRGFTKFSGGVSKIRAARRAKVIPQRLRQLSAKNMDHQANVPLSHGTLLRFSRNSSTYYLKHFHPRMDQL